MKLNSILPLICFCLCFVFVAPAFSGDPTSAKKPAQEFYEIRIYQIFDYEKQQAAESYLKNSLVPALNRTGIDRVGVFTSLDDENNHSIFMVIPFADIQSFATLNDKLESDQEYQTSAADYFRREKDDPIFKRIESRFLQAFSGMPVMEIPTISKEKKSRIFELRLYESHTEDHARRKVQMFNEGEMQIMRDVDLGPVFFGKTLIGPDAPNLVYMLSAPDLASHKQHFKDFLAHPQWLRIKDLPQYKDTVSKIRKWNLKPTSFSQL